MISIVGCGPGGADYVTQAAMLAVGRAEVVFGSSRLLAMFDLKGKRSVELPARSAGAIEVIERELSTGAAAVLVSGDPGLFSLAGPVIRHFGRDRCRVIPGISSVQAAFAAIGVESTDARVISAHGRCPEVAIEDLAEQDKIAVLAGTPEAMQWAAGVADCLAPSHDVFVCENLTLATERVSKASAEQLRTRETASLTVLIFVRRDLL